jgi:hypothetical protein
MTESAMKAVRQRVARGGGNSALPEIARPAAAQAA